MAVTDLPGLNACLNSICTVLLSLGYFYIKRGREYGHKRLMLAAVLTSALFLCSYLVYHALVGSVSYPHHDWTRPLYYAVLIPHVILAAAVVPFVLMALWHAWKGQFVRHVRIARWLWPTWMYVSVSGVIIYLMLYQS